MAQILQFPNAEERTRNWYLRFKAKQAALRLEQELAARGGSNA